MANDIIRYRLELIGYLKCAKLSTKPSVLECFHFTAARSSFVQLAPTTAWLRANDVSQATDAAGRQAQNLSRLSWIHV